jgi:hypothetical protein|tara:strand:- start:593 stop:826 length:234 start_codon:yes stop_codon:yes gene_type:complete
MDSDRWHLGKLREHVRENCEQPEVILKIINSIDRYVGIFVVHLEGTRDTMKPVVGESVEPSPDHLEYILSAGRSGSI